MSEEDSTLTNEQKFALTSVRDSFLAGEDVWRSETRPPTEGELTKGEEHFSKSQDAQLDFPRGNIANQRDH